MNILQIEGGEFLSFKLYTELKKIFSKETDVKIKTKKTVYFCKNTSFNNYLLANSKEDLSVSKTLIKADYAVYKNIFLDSDNLVFTDGKSLISEDEFDDLTHEAVFPLSTLKSADVKTIEALVEILNKRVKTIAITEQNLRKVSNNTVVVDLENLEYIQELISSKDEDSVKIGTEMIVNCNLVKSKPFICYLANKHLNLINIPTVKEFLEDLYKVDFNLITPEMLYATAMLDSDLYKLISRDTLHALNRFLKNNAGVLGIANGLQVQAISLKHNVS